MFNELIEEAHTFGKLYTILMNIIDCNTNAVPNKVMVNSKTCVPTMGKSRLLRGKKSQASATFSADIIAPNRKRANNDNIFEPKLRVKRWRWQRKYAEVNALSSVGVGWLVRVRASQTKREVDLAACSKLQPIIGAPAKSVCRVSSIKWYRRSTAPSETRRATSGDSGKNYCK